MGKEISTFGGIEIEENKLYRYKSPILLKDVNIEKALVPKKISSGGKNYMYFIDYLLNNYKVKSLRIILPKASAYVKTYYG